LPQPGRIYYPCPQLDRPRLGEFTGQFKYALLYKATRSEGAAVNRRVTARHVAEQSKQGGFAFIITAEFVWLHLFGMPIGK
jgi:hypothetical protein